ncbi:hypothetical protein Tco_0301115 [Tanacetum coccineum]
MALSISKLKATRYLDFGLKELVSSLWVESELEYDISAVYGITHWWFRRKEFYSTNTKNDQRKLMRLNELHKFSDGTLTRVLEKLDHMVKDFHLFEYNKGMETRKWSEDDKRRSKDFITAIENDTGRGSIEVKKALSKSENKGKVLTEMELGLEFTQQGSSHELSDTYPILLSFTHCGNKSILRVLRIILVILPEHPSETMVFHNEDGNPARANIKQALGYLKDGDGDGNSQHLRYQFTYMYTKLRGKEKEDINKFKEKLERERREKMEDCNISLLVLSCCVIFDLEPLSLSFDFVFTSEIFKSLSFSLDCLCHLVILYLDQHAHTLHHLKSLLTISLDRLDILEEDLVYQSLRKSLSLNLELS